MADNKQGKYIFGTVKVGEKGQIVIPRDARKVFDIKPGDTVLLLGDVNQGIAIANNDRYMKFVNVILSVQPKFSEEDFQK